MTRCEGATTSLTRRIIGTGNPGQAPSRCVGWARADSSREGFSSGGFGDPDEGRETVSLGPGPDLNRRPAGYEPVALSRAKLQAHRKLEAPPAGFSARAHPRQGV